MANALSLRFILFLFFFDPLFLFPPLVLANCGVGAHRVPTLVVAYSEVSAVTNATLVLVWI